MNRNLLSVFFTSLVCSTLGHEYLKAYQFKGQDAISQSIGFHHARDNQEQCNFICPVPCPSPEFIRPTGSLVLSFIKESNVFAIVNVQQALAIVFQIGKPMALIMNGKTGVSITISIDKEIVVYYPSGSNEDLWKSEQCTFLEYLEKLGPLTNVNNWKNGKTFKLKSVTKEVKNVIISIIQHLDASIAARAEINPDAIVPLISVSINGLLDSSDVLELLLGKLQSSVTVLPDGLTKMVNLVVGLKAIEKKFNGGLQSLIKDDISVSLTLSEDSGFTSLFDLLIQAGVHVDLTKILGDLVKSPEAMLGLAVQLDGGIYTGISGVTALIHNVQLYAAKKISLEALIDILIQVEAASGYVKITKDIWNNILNWYFLMTQAQASKFKTESSWSVLNKFFQDIKEEKLVIDKIDVSAMINILISTSGKPSMSNLVKILLQLKPVVPLSKVMATLYFRLVCFITSGQGLVYINKLLPNISITINFSSGTSIVKQILSRVNFIEIGSYLLRLDVVGAITRLPVFGPILKVLEESIKAVGVATEVTVGSALKASGSILGDLKNLILFGLGRGGNKGAADSGIAGISALGGGWTVSIKTTWVSSESWTSSHGGSAGFSGSSSQSNGGAVSGGHKGSSGFNWSLFGGG